MNEENLDWRYHRHKAFNPHESNLPSEDLPETFERSHLVQKSVYDKIRELLNERRDQQNSLVESHQRLVEELHQ
jgi:hypothetical protein